MFTLAWYNQKKNKIRSLKMKCTKFDYMKVIIYAHNFQVTN